MAKNKWKKFLAFGCIHRPIHDQEACDWIVQQVADYKPDVAVCLGDLYDAEALSSFPKAGISLKAEYDSANEFLKQVRQASGRGTQLVWQQGNHEQRFQRSDFKELRELIEPSRHMPEVDKWDRYDYIHPDSNQSDRLFRIGQVVFSHGFSVSKSALSREAYSLTGDNGLYVYAHTHRPHPVHRCSMGTTKLRCWHVNTGTAISRDYVKQPGGYMQTKNSSEWGCGLVVGSALDGPITGTERNWHAEMRVFRMFDGSHHEAV